MRGHYDEAATCFDRALALWRSEDDPVKQASTLINRGQLHLDLGETERARERFEEALGIAGQAKDLDNEAAALSLLGLLALDVGQPGAALKPLEEALRLRAPGSHGRAVTLTTLGVTYRQLGRLEDARRAYTEALPLLRGPSDSREQAEALGDLGRLEAIAGHDEAALGHLDRALAVFQRLSDPPGMAWALDGKARALRRHGDLEAARELMEKAVTAVERHRFSQASYNTRAGFFSTQQDFYDSLVDLLMEMHRKAPGAGYDAAALETSERSLARSLLDGLAASGADLHQGGADAGLHARQQDLEKEIDALVSRETRLSQDAASSAQLRLVEAELVRRWDELDRVRAGLRSGDPRYAALTQPRPWKTAEIQRGLLDPHTLLLEYRLGETRSFLWAVAPDSLKSFVLPGRAEIEELHAPGLWPSR